MSLERIVSAALEIVDAEGTEAVTMRRVASDLGTGPASLYAYVASRDELLRHVHDRVIAEMTFPDFAALDWQEGVRQFADRAYEAYRSHSDIALLSFADIPTSPVALRATEEMMAAMLRGGVPVRVAAWAMDRLALYIAADAYEGWLLQRRFGGTTDEAEARGREYFDQVSGFFAALPRDQFPTLTGHLDEVMAGEGHERFRAGIDLFIAGIASHVPTGAAERE
jgi:AcrR family transcriptional regulator